MAALRLKALETGGPPMIVHQPYTDGPLIALIEAIAFYVNGLEVEAVGHSAMGGVNFGYRSVEIVGRPPVNRQLLEIAQTTCEEMFNGIR